MFPGQELGGAELLTYDVHWPLNTARRAAVRSNRVSHAQVQRFDLLVQCCAAFWSFGTHYSGRESAAPQKVP